QDALNTIWGIKAKPGAGIAGFIRSRFISFAMVAGVCFLLLVSLVLESVLKSFSHYVQAMFPQGIVIALVVYSIFDLGVVVLLLIYYSSQILLFGAEFTQVYAARAGRALVPAKYAVRA